MGAAMLCIVKRKCDSNMEKSYADFMNEITSDEIYYGLLAHGLFADKLPPLFTSEAFFDYSKTLTKPFDDKPRQYVFYENMRNINVPRPLGIPNPMAYQLLCKCISDNWEKIQSHFTQHTSNQDHTVSRIHLRRLFQKKHLFEMNYDNWRVDGTPEPGLLIGMRFMVSADISTCFPSIYTHSLPWALVSKEIAKSTRATSEWFNQLDHYTQNIKHGETHGLIIGPHVSNLLSEIVLVMVDEELCTKGWKYTRHVDDYRCFVHSYNAAQKFLLDLNTSLRKYGLSLNHKKTKIDELPKGAVAQWTRKLNASHLLVRGQKADFIAVRAYLDLAIELMSLNKDNSAILKYAIKSLASHDMTPNAKSYSVKTIFHLSIIYPYLVSILDEYVFSPFAVEVQEIALFSNSLYKESLVCQNYEATSFSVFFSIKYGFQLKGFTVQDAIDSGDCVFSLLAFIYFFRNNETGSIRMLKKYAREIMQDYGKSDADFNRYWLFIYEVLPISDQKGDWKAMKKEGISFIRSEYLP